MAARKRIGTIDKPWDDQVRSKIQTSMLINRLSDHVFGKVELVATQVNAAIALLRKTIPDLAQVEHSGEVTTTYVARMPAAAHGIDDWQRQHGPPKAETIQ